MGEMERIISATAEVSGITVRDILVRDNRPVSSRPRQVAMVLCRELPGVTFHAVAHAFRRDHTCVIHAERAVAARMTPDLAATMDAIRAKAGVSQ